MKKKLQIIFITITIIIATTIFYMSSMPIKTTKIYSKTINFSTLYHFGIFALLTIFITLSTTRKKLKKNQFLIILLISIIYAISDEVHQIFIPGRYATFKDIIIDSIGSLFALIFHSGIQIFINPKK